MADQHVGPYPPAQPELGEGVLEGEERGLGEPGLVEVPRLALLAEHERLDGAAQVRGEEPVAGVQVLAEDRVARVQRRSHAGVLRALAGEQQRHLALWFRRGLLVEEREQFVAVADHAGDTVAEVGPAERAGAADLVETEVGVVFEVPPMTGGQLAQRLGCLGGEREDPGAAGLGVARGGGRGLFEDGGRDGAGEAEGVDQGAARRRRPGDGLGRDGDAVAVPGNVRGRRLPVQVREDLPGLQLEHGLDQSADTGRGLHVSDVGLQGADGDALGEGRVDGAELDRVAQRRARTVRLHVTHVGRFEQRRVQRRPHHRLLRGAVGHGQAAALAVLAHRGAADQGQHGVAVGLGPRQPFEDDGAAALAAAVAVGPLVEGLALAVRSEHPGLREDHVVARVVDDVDAAGQRDGALAAAQRLHRQVEGHQRGGAGGVHRETGPAPAEDVRDPARHRAVGGAGAGVGVHVLVRQLHHFEVEVDAAGAEVHGAVTAPQAGGVDARVFERLPAGLQREPLLRVDVLGLLGGDAEEPGVEAVEVPQEAAAGGADPARGDLALPVVRELRGVPPVLGHRPGPGAAGAQELRESLGCVVLTGEPQADTDDRNGFVLLQQQVLQELALLTLVHARTSSLLVKVVEELSYECLLRPLLGPAPALRAEQLRQHVGRQVFQEAGDGRALEEQRLVDAGAEALLQALLELGGAQRGQAEVEVVGVQREFLAVAEQQCGPELRDDALPQRRAAFGQGQGRQCAVAGGGAVHPQPPFTGALVMTILTSPRLSPPAWSQKRQLVLRTTIAPRSALGSRSSTLSTTISPSKRPVWMARR